MDESAFSPIEQEARLFLSNREVQALAWFRARYWSDVSSALVPDSAIAHMLLRLALTDPQQLAARMEQLLGYREAEGVSVSDLINRKLESRPEYSAAGASNAESARESGD
jgi:hypothetical protein